MFVSIVSQRSCVKVDLRSPVLLASLSSNTGIIKWGDTQYRGDLKIVTNSNNKSCDLINEISMEDYIATLLSKEMNAKLPVEALKAQAVAARTYAVHKIKTNRKVEFHLENSERFQVNGSLNDETQKQLKPRMIPKGLVLISKRLRR